MELLQFLIKSKISGYATGGEGKELKLADGGLKFYLTEDDLEYSDVYYGFNPFIGQETVRQQDKVIWVMNYSGGTIYQWKEAVSVYQFLKLALQNPDKKLPLRGPEAFKKDNFAYRNSVSGDIGSFFGEEVIQVDNRPVYRLLYHGGVIKRI